jgi:hypothetical protein
MLEIQERDDEENIKDVPQRIDHKLYAYEFNWSTAAKSRFTQSFQEAYKPALTGVIHRDNF